MTLRKLLASLVAVTLLAAGVPAIASTAGAAADCVAASSAGNDHGCCGESARSDCSLACAAASLTAAVGNAAEAVRPRLGFAPPVCIAVSPESPARPPDTAPPKTFSA